ncbi:ribosome small subunit-dependent GTPase A [Stackebrandtia soli]|uniref:ribosome small subunit-dependent GTPase A n=1 Tax=Stackebrandtia soli TaxID=1892856 RepID=UPI0039EC7F93
MSLASLGWDAHFSDAYARFNRRGNKPGRISRVDRGVCTVLTERGVTRASLAGRMLGIIAKDPLAMPSVGDWAVIKTWSDERSTIEAILPRRSAIVRSSSGRAAEGQAIAANADSVAVVEALDPDPDPGRIERLMALAHESGATPLLILTKADAVPDAPLLAADLAGALGDVEVHTVSAHTGDGLDALADYLGPGRTLALIGASGAGKSSLVNALAGTSVMVTRALRADGRGRHTTSHRALVPVPSGGTILDTPGLRLVGLFDRRPGDATVPADGLARAFEDLDELAGGCRFRDCRHESEPDCAVLAAVGDGVITARRLENWRKLQREQSFERRRIEARQRNQRRVTKSRDRDKATRR